jgi:hypothetical protein
MTPLDQFIARWNAVPMPVPYVDVINTPIETNDLPDQWGSAVLEIDERADVTLGSNPHVEERGRIIVGLFERSGKGRNGLDAAVAALKLYFHQYMTPDNTLQITAVVGPEAIEPEADGEWWRLGFTLPCQIWSRRVEPVPLQVP